MQLFFVCAKKVVNFLAHALLAGDLPSDRLGGVIGDFIKGVLPAGLPLDIAEGVRLHRRIDGFADTHPVFRRSRHRISSERRRVSGVMVDMFYDHFLARHWRVFCQRPLEHFTADIYALMEKHSPLLPSKLIKILPYMRSEDWLTGYRSVTNISLSLDRMAERMRRDAGLAGGGRELIDEYKAFETDFFEFIEDAICFSGDYRKSRP